MAPWYQLRSTGQKRATNQEAASGSTKANQKKRVTPSTRMAPDQNRPPADRMKGRRVEVFVKQAMDVGLSYQLTYVVMLATFMHHILYAGSTVGYLVCTCHK